MLFPFEQKPQSEDMHDIQFHDGGCDSCTNLGHVELRPKWSDSVLLMRGAFKDAAWNTADNATRHVMIPNIDMIINFRLPYRSTKAMLTIEPIAFRPDVMRERAIAVCFEANPAS